MTRNINGTQDAELSKLGALIVSPLKKALGEAILVCEQDLWKNKMISKKPIGSEPGVLVFSDREPQQRSHALKLVIDNKKN